MTRKPNPWFVAALILALICVGLLVWDSYGYLVKRHKFGNFSLTDSQIDLIKHFADKGYVKICDYDLNECITLFEPELSTQLNTIGG